jgi:hypothetical protein
MRSVKVVFPLSMWAEIPMLRSLAMCSGISSFLKKKEGGDREGEGKGSVCAGSRGNWTGWSHERASIQNRY